MNIARLGTLAALLSAEGFVMTSSVSSALTPAEFLNSVTSAVLDGGAANPASPSITDGASLQDAVASQVLSGSSSTDSTSSLLADISNSGDLQNAIAGAILGSGSNGGSGDPVMQVAALGATLNSMAEAAQTALLSTSTSVRANALNTYQSLYDSLNQSPVNIDGSAGNTASLGIGAPGDWANTDIAAGAAAITGDMTNVVRARAVVQQMMPSLAATAIDSELL